LASKSDCPYTTRAMSTHAAIPRRHAATMPALSGRQKAHRPTSLGLRDPHVPHWM